MKEYMQPDLEIFSAERTDILTVSDFGTVDCQALDQYDISAYFDK